MTLPVKFGKTVTKSCQTAIVFTQSDLKLGTTAKDLDKKSSKRISEALEHSNTFTGKHGETCVIPLPAAKTDYHTLIVVGLGDLKELDALKAEELGGKILKKIKAEKITHAALFVNDLENPKTLPTHELAAHIANGMNLAAYTYDKYKEKKPSATKHQIKKIELITPAHANAQKLYQSLENTSQGIFLARNLVNEPPNTLYPEAFAQIIKDELKPLGVDVQIIDDKKLLKMKAGAISAVGQGSARLPRMVIMHWKGDKKAKKSKPALTLVGKGVTFDTGGISIKPGAGMDEMKMDMGGAAAVVGAMKAIALNNTQNEIIGAVGLAENMPSDCAYRPGDVITSLSGKTIEVLNTDAEGRLVLADVLTYVQDTYGSDRIIDLATLTGAMMVALGHEYCGTYANNDTLWSSIQNAGEAAGEKLWRMPLDDAWKKSMEGAFGDVQNMSKLGRYAGACTAAGFIEHFIQKDVQWAHMDIAGTAWIKTEKPTVPKYGTGFGVRTLEKIAQEK